MFPPCGCTGVGFTQTAGRCSHPAPCCICPIALLVYWQARESCVVGAHLQASDQLSPWLGDHPAPLFPSCSADTVALKTLPQVRESSFQPLSRSCLPAPLLSSFLPSSTNILGASLCPDMCLCVRDAEMRGCPQGSQLSEDRPTSPV